MTNISKSLGRTVHYNNFNFYSTDGFGRDGYISYNNGGYWKDNLKAIIAKPKYPVYSKPFFQSLGKVPPPVRYHSDGTGRDSYVVDRAGGLVKNFAPLNQIPLSYYLRNSDTSPHHTHQNTFYTQKECQTNAFLNKIQKDVVNRLFQKKKNRFVLFRGKRKVKVLDNLNLYDPILRKSQSTKSFMTTANKCSCLKPTIVFSPSSKLLMPKVKPVVNNYTTILHNANLNC